MNPLPINLLLVEDSEADAELTIDTLREAGLAVAVRHVEDEPRYCAALDERLPDAILIDVNLPRFSGYKALRIARERCPTVPILFVTGTMPEEKIIDVMRQGATDVIYKHQIKRLPPALTHAITEAQFRREMQSEERELQKIEQNLRIALDFSPNCVIVVDQDGKYIYVNRKAEELLGFCQNDLLGMTIFRNPDPVGIDVALF